MRLICPNCDAQYEVDVRAIPVEGRDVQCSNCGHTWFQHHPDHQPAEDAFAEPGDDPRVGDDLAAPADAPAGPDEARGNEPDTGPPPGPAAGETVAPEAEAAQDPAPQPAARRREIDSSVAALLREEAEREARAREAERAGVEMQPELGLPAAPPTARAAEPRKVPAFSFDDDDDDPLSDAGGAGAHSAPRRGDLLPDIDEINSNLRAVEARDSMAPPTSAAPEPERGGRGFRFGFSLTLLLAGAALAVYGFTPQISARVPAAEPVLARYGQVVDGGRVWLDAMMQRTINALGDGS